MVALFAIAYGLLRLLWPSLSSSSTVVVASIVASPLAIALMWPRLVGFKALGFEVSLSQSSAQVEVELGSAITAQQYYSGDENLIERWANALSQPGVELVEVNLRNEDYWWSSRLYLLAAMMTDYTEVEHIVFVRDPLDRVFVGFARASDVRTGLAAAFPGLERTYLDIHSRADLPPPSAAIKRVTHVVQAWTASMFTQGGLTVAETDISVIVTTSLLKQWLDLAGKQLVVDSVDWSGVTDTYLTRSLLTEFTSSYVALLRHGQLRRVVSRSKLALRIALNATR